MIKGNEAVFRKLLLQWNKKDNKRMMPWKHEKDAYKVWLSEVILQQTRVEQGWSYYEKFIAHYPDVKALAAAKDEDAFKLWEGLGYYSRCRNLLFTARFIVEKYDGVFPKTFDKILQLKGIGEYTASAIASFCFNLPYAVLDGNVFRVLSRFFGVDIPVDSTKGKQFFKALANESLDKKNAGLYNQAIMDFGATICKPAPLCTTCIMQKNCVAYQTGKVLLYPVKEKKLVRKERYFNYFIITCNHEVFIHQRLQKDIWQNLFEFYLLETSENVQWTIKLAGKWLKENLQIETPDIHIQKAKPQTLTHRLINGYFISVSVQQKPETPLHSGCWIAENQLHQKSFPRFLHQCLK